MEKTKNNNTPQAKKAFRELLIFGGVAVILFLADIISKWVVQNTCVPGEMNAVIPNFFYITLSYNTGAAFSAGANWGVFGRVLGILISVVMSFLIIFYWIRKNKEFSTFERAIAALMAAGAVGNLIDRAFYWEGTTGFNGVIDFLQFYLGGGPNSGNVNMFNPFATFNIADACLVIGILLFIIDLIVSMVQKGKDDPLRKDPRLEKAEPKATEASKPTSSDIEFVPSTEKESKDENKTEEKKDQFNEDASN